MLKELVTFYNKHTYTHNYIIGFTDGKRKALYAVPMQIDNIAELARLDGSKIRVNLDRKALHHDVITGKAIRLMSLTEWAEFTKAFNAETKLNKGYAFEKAVADHYNIEWAKDDTPFYKGADLTINGIGYQLKYENNATWTSEKVMNNYLNK